MNIVAEQAQHVTATEFLNASLREYIERKYKPQGMCSNLFWELHKILVQTGRQNNGTS